MGEGVVLLATVLEEIAVAGRVVGNIVLHSDLMRAMNDVASLLRVADDISLHSGAWDILTHVEVDGIASECALLSKVLHRNYLKTLSHTGRIQDDQMTTNQSICRGAVSLKDDGTGESSDLYSKVRTDRKSVV